MEKLSEMRHTRAQLLLTRKAAKIARFVSLLIACVQRCWIALSKVHPTSLIIIKLLPAFYSQNSRSLFSIYFFLPTNLSNTICIQQIKNCIRKNSKLMQKMKIQNLSFTMLSLDFQLERSRLISVSRVLCKVPILLEHASTKQSIFIMWLLSSPLSLYRTVINISHTVNSIRPSWKWSLQQFYFRMKPKNSKSKLNFFFFCSRHNSNSSFAWISYILFDHHNMWVSSVQNSWLKYRFHNCVLNGLILLWIISYLQSNIILILKTKEFFWTKWKSTDKKKRKKKR